MYEDYEIPKRRLSEEDVLAMLIEEYRQREHPEFRNKYGIALTFDTTVAEYEETFDVPRRVPELGRSFNAFFGLKIDRAICEVLHPPKKRTLWDLCRFIVSRNAEAPALRAVPVLGSECPEAGAFVTIRALLRNAGAEVSDLAPSTPLAEYTRRHTRAFYDLALMAPGKLPFAHVERDFVGLLLVMLLGLSILALANLWYRSSELLGWTMGTLLLSIVVAYVVSHRLPREVRFGELKTFRDLCRALTR